MEYLDLRLLQGVDLLVDAPQRLGVRRAVILRVRDGRDLLERLLVEMALLDRQPSTERAELRVVRAGPSAHADSVYTLMSSASAAVATVTGSRSPALLTPSVSRVTSLFSAVESLSMFAAVAMPLPMAVPSWMRSLSARSTSLSRRRRTLWSRVGGLWTKASREKTTRPMRSYFRSSMKSAIICLAASSLCGSKSSCAHAARNVERDGDVHPLAPNDLPRVRGLRPGDGDNHESERHEAQAPKRRASPAGERSFLFPTRGWCRRTSCRRGPSAASTRTAGRPE